MTLAEITVRDHLKYKAFFLRGITEHADCFRISPENERNAPFPTRGTPDSFTLAVVSPTGELAGVVSFQREAEGNRTKLRHKGLLFRMYVAAEHAGKGLGDTLIREVIARAEKLADVEQINLTVVASNATAKRLYRKLGFETFALERNAIKSGETYYDEEQMVRFMK